MIERAYPPVKPVVSAPSSVLECDYVRFRTGTKTGSELGVKPGVLGPAPITSMTVAEIYYFFGGAGRGGGNAGWREVV
jgi:hypothetical protein